MERSQSLKTPSMCRQPSIKRGTSLKAVSMGLGFTAGLEKKKAFKFDPERANEVMVWMKAVMKYGDPEVEQRITEVNAEVGCGF